MMRNRQLLNILSNVGKCRQFSTSMFLSAKAAKTPGIDLHEREWQLAFHQKEKGKIYDKKPFKFRVKEGQRYIWCACGNSRHQPMCDGTHLNTQLKIKQYPIVFKAPKTMDVWFCNCKQTKNPPFCDGSHLDERVKAAVKD
ncbi:CDGSH iron-sulfur domain-containing protein 3, mitochondrial-like [Macrobrachium nipponense]|uniref:CDGSH iron-sulfur domain-containing protein 3, mitochondrial-like n=1 Tax=Macrobrachium nipponense TaxID=159736 RepID=UPI0030C83F6A